LAVVEAVMGDFLHIKAKKWLDKMEKRNGGDE